jgi:hypothetical protein
MFRQSRAGTPEAREHLRQFGIQRLLQLVSQLAPVSGREEQEEARPPVMIARDFIIEPANLAAAAGVEASRDETSGDALSEAREPPVQQRKTGFLEKVV